MRTMFERLRTLPSAAVLALLMAAPAALAQSAPESAEPAPAAPEAAVPPPADYPPSAPPAAAAPSRRTPGSQPRKVGVLIRMAFDFGGDELGKVVWTDGKTTTLKAGQLATFSGGVLYHPDAPWALEATLGYKFDKANASNGTIGFTRVPLDVVASFQHGGHRLGVGPTVHFAPEFSCDATGVCNYKYKYDTALGAIAQYAYGLPVGRNAGLELAVRYTMIEYKGSGLLTKNGSAPGFVLGAWF